MAGVDRCFSAVRVACVFRLLPDSYRAEIAFFEGIRTRKYSDDEFLAKRIRMLAHFVDKSCTLAHKANRDHTAAQVEDMVAKHGQERPSDQIACQWARQVLAVYRNGAIESANRPDVISPNAAGTLVALIRTRRSVRSYTSQNVGEDTLKQILDAGLWSPTGCNRQPIEYLIVNQREDVVFCQKYAGENACFPQEAAVNIVVLVDPRTYALPHQRHMAYLDGGACIQNILLTLHASGLGACWMFWAKHDDAFNKRFSLSPWLLPVGLVCVGHIDKRPPIVPARKAVADAIHDARRLSSTGISK